MSAVHILPLSIDVHCVLGVLIDAWSRPQSTCSVQLRYCYCASCVLLLNFPVVIIPAFIDIYPVIHFCDFPY